MGVVEMTVAYFAERYLSKYFSNFDASKLKLSLWAGKITLNDLKLKPAALDDLKLPIAVAAGKVSKVEVTVSWTALLKSPIVIEVDEVLLQIVPGSDHPFDAKAEAEAALLAKKALLKQLQDSLDAKQSGKQDDTSKTTFSIVRNLKLTVNRVYARYVDTGTTTETIPFVCGLSLLRVTLCTTDDKWKIVHKPTTNAALGLAHKQLDLQELALYWDVGASHAMGVEGDEAIMADMAAHFDKSRPRQHSTVVPPINTTGRLTVRKAVKDGLPQQAIDLATAELGLKLSRAQYQSVLRAVDYVSWLQVRVSFGHLRPTARLGPGSRALWWRFAFEAVAEPIRRVQTMWSWAHIREHCRLRRDYLALHGRRLAGDKLDKADTAALTRIEERLDIGLIVAYRAAAKARAPKKAATRSFFGWLSSAKPEGPGAEGVDVDQATAEVLASVDDEEPFEVPTNHRYINAMAKLTVPKLFLELQDDGLGSALQPLLRSETIGLELKAWQRSAAGAFAAQASVRDVGLFIPDAQPGALPPPGAELSNAVVRRAECHEPLLSMQVETNPLPREGATAHELKVDTRLTTRFLPLEITVTLSALDDVRNFFLVPEDVDLSDVQAYVEDTASALRDQTRAGLEYAVDQRKVVDVSVQVDAPVLVLAAEEPSRHADTTLLIADLGTLAVKSNLSRLQADALSKSQQRTLSEVRELAYDRFEVDISHVQVLVATPADGEAWRRHIAEPEAQSDFRVLHTSMHLSLAHCLEPDQQELPQITLDAQLGHLDAFLSDRSLRRALALANRPSKPAKPALFPAGPTAAPRPRFQRTTSLQLPIAAPGAVSVQDLELLVEGLPAEPTAEQPELAVSADDADGGGSESSEDEFEDALSELSFSGGEGEGGPEAGAGEAARSAPASDRAARAKRPSLALAKLKRASQAVARISRANKLRRAAAVRVIVDGKCSVKTIALQLRHQAGPAGEVPIASLTLTDLAAQFKVRKHDVHATASLQAFSLVDCTGPAERPIIRTGEGDELPPSRRRIPGGTEPNSLASEGGSSAFVRIDYRSCMRSSPMFHTHFKSVENRISAALEGCHFIVDLQTADGLARVLPMFLRALDEAGPGEGVPPAGSALADGGSAPEAAPAGTEAMANSLQLKAKARVGLLTLTLADGGKDVVQLSLCGLEAKVTQSASSLRIKATMDDLDAYDHTARLLSMRHALAVTEGHQVFNAAVVLPTDPTDNASLSLNAGRLNFIFTQRFVATALEFGERLQAATAGLQQPKGEAAPVVSPAPGAGAETPAAPGQQWNLDVRLDAPQIIVPRSSKSLQAIVADFGTLAVSNGFYSADAGFFQEVDLALNDFQIVSCTLSETVDADQQASMLGCRTICAMPRLPATVVQLVSELSPSMPPTPSEPPVARSPTPGGEAGEDGGEGPLDLRVKVDVDVMEATVARSDYHLAMAVLAENLAEKSALDEHMGRTPPLVRTMSSASSVSSLGNAAGPEPEADGAEHRPSDAANLNDSPEARLALAALAAPALGLGLSVDLSVRSVRLSLFLDDEDTPGAALGPEHGLTVAHLAGIDLGLVKDPSTSTALTLNAAVRSLVVSDARPDDRDRERIFSTVFQQGRHTGRLTVEALNGSEAGAAAEAGAGRATASPTQPLLTARVVQKTKSVRLLSRQPLDLAALHEDLKQYGTVVRAYQCRSPDGATCVAFVEFSQELSAPVALERHAGLFPDSVFKADLGFPTDTRVEAEVEPASLKVALGFLLGMAAFFEPPAALVPEGFPDEEAHAAHGAELGSGADVGRPAPADFATPRVMLLGQSDGDTRIARLPTPTDHLSAELKLKSLALMLLENEFNRCTQTFLATLSSTVQVDNSGDNVWVGVAFNPLTVTSECVGVRDTQLQSLAPVMLYGSYLVKGGDTTINLRTGGPISLQMAYKDFVSLQRIAARLETGSPSRRTGNHAWDQHDFPVVISPPQITPSATPHKERLVVDQTVVNLALIDNQTSRQVPLLTASTAVEAAIYDWSNAAHGSATLQLAIAELESRSTQWQPLILGSKRDKGSRETSDAANQDEGSPLVPWQLDVEISTHEKKWLDLNDSNILDSTDCGKATGPNGERGGKASHLLDGDKTTFWCPRARGHHRNWVVFDFGRTATICNFAFFTLGVPDHQIKTYRLETANTPTGPWKIICRDHCLAEPSVFSSPRFKVSGRYFRWKIMEVHGRPDVWVSAVQFEQDSGGLGVQVTTPYQLEATLCSEFLARLTTLVARLKEETHSYTAETVEQLGLELDESKSALQVGTHRVVNRTGFPLKFSPARSHNKLSAKLISLDPDAVAFFSFPTEQPDCISNSLNPEYLSLPPIVDVRVINHTKREAVPKDYTVIPKSLNGPADQADKLYLCYKRSDEEVPLSDLWVIYSDQTDGIRETVPCNFLKVAGDVNQSAKGRTIYLCKARGTGTAILDLAVAFVGSHESIPKDHVGVKKNLNQGAAESNRTILSFVRQNATYNSDFKWGSCTPVGITDLHVAVSRGLAKDKQKDALLAGPQDGCPTPWISHCSGQLVLLNQGARGDDVVVLHRRDPRAPPITAIQISSDCDEPGWTTIPGDLNSRTNGRKQFLQVRRDPGAPPIVDIQLVHEKDTAIPPGFHLADRSLNHGVRGAKDLFLAYKLGQAPAGSYDLVTVQRRESFSDTIGLVADGKADYQLQALELISNSQAVSHQCSFEVEGWMPLQQVSVDTVGETHLVLSERWKKPARIVVEVTAEEGLKTVTLRSPLKLVNDFEVPLELALAIRQPDEEKCLRRLDPGEELDFKLGQLDQVPSGALKPVYRFWCPSQQIHFYGSDPCGFAQTGLSFEIETCLGYLFAKEGAGTCPVWAKLPTKVAGGGYALATDRKESRIDGRGVVKGPGYMRKIGFEVIGHAYAEAQPGTLPVYRYWHHRLKDVLHTTDEHEVGVTQRREAGNHGYVLDGIEAHLLRHPGLIRVRPVGVSHDWSDEQRDLRCSLEERGRRSLLCPPLSDGPTQAPFSCEVVSPSRTCWRLEPPISFTNDIPYAVAVAVVAGPDAKPEQWEFLAPGQTRGSTAYSAAGGAHLRMALADPATGRPLKWSVGAPITPGTDGRLLIEHEPEGGVVGRVAFVTTARRRFGDFGPLDITLVCPYVVYNRTGAPLSLWALGDPAFRTLRPTAEDSDPLLYAPEEGAAADETVMCNGRGDRTRAFTVNSMVGHASLRVWPEHMHRRSSSKKDGLAEGDNTGEYSFEWRWGNASRLYRVFTFYPKVTVVNTLPAPVYVGFVTGKPSIPEDYEVPVEIVAVGPRATVPFDRCVLEQPLALRLADSLWSRPWSPRELGFSTLKCAEVETGALLPVRVGVSESFSRVVVRVLPSLEAPLRVANHSHAVAIEFWQKGCSHPRHRLAPGRQMRYAFDDVRPAAAKALLFAVVGAPASEPVEVGLNPVGPVPVRYHDPDGEDDDATGSAAAAAAGVDSEAPAPGGLPQEAVVVVTDADGTSNFVFADSLEHVRLVHGLSALVPEESIELDVNIAVGEIGLSVVESCPRRADALPFELTFIKLRGLGATYSRTTFYEKYSLTLDDLQIDATDADVKNPVVLHEVVEHKDRDVLHIVAVVCSGQVGDGRAQDWTEYFTVLVQPLHLRLDGGFVARAQDFYRNAFPPPTGGGQPGGAGGAGGKSGTGGGSTGGGGTGGGAGEAAAADPGNKKYYKHIEMHSIRIIVTLSNMEEALARGDNLAAALGVTLLNINEAPFTLNSVLLKDALVTDTELSDKLTSLYQSRVIHFLKGVGLIKALGSLELIGDPFNNLQKLGFGVHDFFVEPYKTVVQSPDDFGSKFKALGTGIGTGASHLGRGMIGAVTGFSSKITGSVGSAFAVLSMDEEFQQARRDRAGPTSAKEGFRTGFGSLVSGFRDGAAGLVMQPINETRKGGTKGFFKGMGKGVAGLVAKPTAGIIDMVSTSLAGIESEVSLKDSARRCRAPRVVNITGTVPPYDAYRAEGALLLKKDKELGERYRHDQYISHTTERLGGGDSHSLRHYFFTSQHVIVVDQLKGKCTVVHEIRSSKVVGFRLLRDADRLEGMELMLDDTGTMALKIGDAKALQRLASEINMLISMGTQGTYKKVPEEWCAFEVPAAVAQARSRGLKRAPSTKVTDEGPLETVQVELWENQRKYFGTWRSRLLPTERHAWTSRNGRDHWEGGKDGFDVFPGWRWITDWCCDPSLQATDPDGWTYAGSFATKFEQWKPENHTFTTVRRRRWIRQQRGPSNTKPWGGSIVPPEKGGLAIPSAQAGASSA